MSGQTIPPPPPGFQLHGQAGPPPPPPGFVMASQPAPAPEMSFPQQLKRSAIMAGRDVVQGALAIPELVHDALVRAPVNAISEAVGSDYRIAPGAQQIDSYMNALGVPNPQPQNAIERVGGDVIRGTAGALGGLGVAKTIAGAARPVISGIGELLASNPGTQIAATAGGSGAAGVGREAGATPGQQAALGLIGAFTPAGIEGGVNVLTRGARGLLESPDVETVHLAQQAAQHGIRLIAPQVTPSKTAKLLDSVTGHIPLSGAGKVQASQQEQFNRAVGRTFGAESPKITPEVFRSAKKRIGGEFNRLTSRNDMQITPDLIGRLRSISEDAAAFGDDATHNAVSSVIKRVVKQSKDSKLPGQAYQSIDSKLGKIAKNGGEKAYYIGEVREALRDAMGDSINPQDQAAWTAARRAYRNLKTVEPLVAKSPNGDISPAALMGRVTSNAPGKVSMASGTRGDLGDLARIGQQFLKSKIPDSGTARRIAVLDALKGLGGVAVGAGGTVAPMATLGIGGGMVGTARAVQKLLQSQRLLDELTGQSQGTQALQRRLIQSANPAAQVLTQQP